MPPAMLFDKIITLTVSERHREFRDTRRFYGLLAQ